MTTQQILSSILYLLYLVPILFLARHAYKKAVTIENFLVSNWDIPLPLLIATLTASLGTAAYFLAAVSMGYAEGAFEGMSTTLGLGVCLILAGVFWAAPIRRLHGWTMADYYGLRFASKGLGTYCGIIMATGTSIFMVGGMAVAGGYLLSAITGISFQAAVIVYACVVGAYCIAGGLWAVAYTDALQISLAIIGIFAIMFAILTKASAISPGALFSPEHWNVSHLFTAKGSLFWFLFLSIAIGDIPACDMGQRACGGRSPRITKKAFIWAGIILSIVGLVPAIASEGLKIIYPNFQGNAELLWINFIVDYMPAFVAALLLVLFISAGMSTIDSSYVAATAMWIKNIGLDLRGAKYDEKRLLKVSRVIVLCIVISSALMALFFQEALPLVYAVFEIIFVSLTWPVVLGPYWKRLSAKANWVAITVGLLVYVVFTIWFTNTGNVGGVNESIAALSETLPGVLGMFVGLYAFPVFWGATISLICTIICAFIFNPTREELLAYELQRTSVNDDIEGYPAYEASDTYHWQAIHMTRKLREEYLKPEADFKALVEHFYDGVAEKRDERDYSEKAYQKIKPGKK
jgi:SSS family solute:Na+ symporter